MIVADAGIVVGIVDVVDRLAAEEVQHQCLPLDGTVLGRWFVGIPSGTGIRSAAWDCAHLQGGASQTSIDLMVGVSSRLSAVALRRTSLRSVARQAVRPLSSECEL